MNEGETKQACLQFEIWWASGNEGDGEDDAPTLQEQASFYAGFEAGVAWKQERDAAAVRAVRAEGCGQGSSEWFRVCGKIMQRITGSATVEEAQDV